MKRNETLSILLSMTLLIVSIGGLLNTIQLKRIEKQQTAIHQQDSVRWVDLNNKYKAQNK